MREAAARWLTVAAVLASFFWMLGTPPLFDVDEGAFSQATLEMFQRGDFLSTYLNGQPRYDKPILVYWLQALAVTVIGPSEWAFRLPSALCATGWAWLTYLFASRHYGVDRGLFAAALLATSLGVYIIGRAATADALLNLLIAATMFAAWLHLSSGERKWLYATHAAIGLGVVAKGPIAMLVPAAQRIRDVWRDDLQLYLLVWFVFVFVFFSVSGTKLPHYLLYGYTGLVLLMAVHGFDVKAAFWPLIPVLGFFFALLALPYGVHYGLGHIPDAYYREVLEATLERFDTFYFAFLAVLSALVMFAMLEHTTPLPRKLAVFGLAAVASLSTLIVPTIGFAQQGSLKEAAILCREQQLNAVLWRLNAPSFSVYRGAPTPSRDPKPGDVIVTRSNRLADLPKGLSYDLLYSKRGIVLARIRA